MEFADNRELGIHLEEMHCDDQSYIYLSDSPFDAFDPEVEQHVEIKATTARYINDRPGKFRLKEGQHRHLVDARGRYEFILYEDVGDSLSIADVCSRRPESLSLNWTNWRHGIRESKVSVHEIFDL